MKSQSDRNTPEKPISSLTQRERAAYLNLYLQKNRGRAAIKPPPRAARATARIMRPLSKKFGAGTSMLKARWPEIVGARYAKLSKPARLIGGKDGNTLLIIARGPAAALLSANSRNILDKVNHFMGGKPISRLKITQGEIAMDRQTTAPLSSVQAKRPVKSQKRGLTPSEQTALQNKLERITNDRLRQALDGLGRSVIGRQP